VADALAAGTFYGETRVHHRRSGLALSDVIHRVPRHLPVHSHEHAYFSLLLSGAYEEQCGRRTLVYRPGSLGFHPPGLVHRDRLGDAGGRFFIAELDGAWLERARDIGRGDWRPHLLPPSAAGLAAMLWDETRSPQAGSAAAIEALLLELLLAAREGGRPERSAPSWLGRVRDAIEAEPLRGWTLPELAAEAGVHPVHLARTVRRFEGRPLGALLREARIRAGCRLLESDALALAEVAVRTGFADQSHFTRVFRRVTGTTPAAFRRSRRR
jgi:AraC family transcriptional regulator